MSDFSDAIREAFYTALIKEVDARFTELGVQDDVLRPNAQEFLRGDLMLVVIDCPRVVGWVLPTQTPLEHLFKVDTIQI